MNAPAANKCTHCDRSFRKPVGLIDHMRVVHDVRMTVTGNRRETDNLRPSVTQIEPRCIECGKLAQLVKGSVIYPHRPDLWHKHLYQCSCGAYVGCHPGSIVPLGYPCGPETRQARMAAHNVFDPLWRGDRAPMNRHEAYKWLAEEMNMQRDKCHIGMMTSDQAREVFKIVAQRVRSEQQQQRKVA